MGRARSRFGLLVCVDSRTVATLGLHYSGVGKLHVRRQVVPRDFCGSRMLWLYDEIDLGTDDGGFRHSVFFSDGSELELEAREVHVSILETVYSQFELSRTVST